jgi:pyruvate/2-oxoglutarate dehydrogenase complex dihydrolipoamide acyltransferase (E2) component
MAMGIRNIQAKRWKGWSAAQRAIASAWSRPECGCAFGSIEVDVANVLDWKSQQVERVALDPAVLVVRAVAMALRKTPRLNGVMRLGELYLRDSVDVLLATPLEAKAGRGGMGSVVVRNADRKSSLEIAEEVAAGIKRELARQEAYELVDQKMGRWPGKVYRLWLLLMRFVGITLNLRVPGTVRDPSGSCMVANLSGFQFDAVYAPLIPVTGHPLVVTVGPIRERAGVRDGVLVVKRTVVLSATYDHRFGDALLMAAFLETIRSCFEHPGQYL